MAPSETWACLPHISRTHISRTHISSTHTHLCIRHIISSPQDTWIIFTTNYCKKYGYE